MAFDVSARTYRKRSSGQQDMTKDEGQHLRANVCTATKLKEKAQARLAA